MTVVIWGTLDDEPTARVAEALEDLGAEYVMLDADALPHATLDEQALRIGWATIPLDGIRGIYVRPEVDAAPPAEVALAMLSLCDVHPSNVVNRPAAMAANGSKPYQLAQIARWGFAVPETLVTTDAEAVEEFRERHGDVIYKSVSGVRSRVARLTSAHRARLPNVATAPTQFQQFVAGVDHRVHVAGEALFATRIESDADDYRYDTNRARMRAVELPPDVEARCRAMSAWMGMTLTGIDLRLTADGRWYCFEVNPSPAFTYFEEATGQPIAAAIARTLTSFC